MVKYKKSFFYKYTLQEDYTVNVGIAPPKEIDTPHFKLTVLGWLTIKKGYAWDGATCAIDTESFMRGSLVHDCLYQIIREGYLDQSVRKLADEALISICKEDGMCWLRRQWVYAGVLLFGGKFTEPELND